MRPMQALLLSIALTTGVAHAQSIFEHNNEIGIYTDPSPTAENAGELSTYFGDLGMFEVYVVCTSPYNTRIEREISVVGGFNFGISFADHIFLLDYSIPGTSSSPYWRHPSRISTQQLTPTTSYFSVAVDSCYCPTVEQKAHIMTLLFGVFVYQPGSIWLSPWIGIRDYNDNNSLAEAYPVSGDFGSPVFGVFQAVIPSKTRSWGDIKALFHH